MSFLQTVADKLGGFFSEPGPVGPPSFAVTDLPDGRWIPNPTIWDTFDGEKFPGGFGATRIFDLDYFTLRARSAQLDRENLYAHGLISRLITNEINTGLLLEATPNSELLGIQPEMDEDGDTEMADPLEAWSEDVENRFQIWADAPALCDYLSERTFGALQRAARREALVAGDTLINLVFNSAAKVPQVQIISGARVKTPWEPDLVKDKTIKHGVEIDKQGRHSAYWVEDGETFKRIPAWGPKSGRRIAWLLYGTPRRIDDVRGMPILALILQSLKELDRYRDAAQRKALINSLLTVFVKKGADKPGTKPFTSGAVRRDTGSVDSSDRTFDLQNLMPGLVFEELQMGEEPVPFSTAGTDLNFTGFEAVIIHAIAWANEIPPEILTLAFEKSYSAARGAVNEFKLYLNRVRSEFSDNFTEPIYREWLLSQVLAGKIDAPGLLESWRDPAAFDTFGAWIASDWTGAIKPSIDIEKDVKAYTAMVEQGFMTRDRATKELTGTKFSKNVKRLKTENEQLKEAGGALSAPAPAPDGGDGGGLDEEESPEEAGARAGEAAALELLERADLA